MATCSGTRFSLRLKLLAAATEAACCWRLLLLPLLLLLLSAEELLLLLLLLRLLVANLILMFLSCWPRLLLNDRWSSLKALAIPLLLVELLDSGGTFSASWTRFNLKAALLSKLRLKAATDKRLLLLLLGLELCSFSVLLSS